MQDGLTQRRAARGDQPQPKGKPAALRQPGLDAVANALNAAPAVQRVAAMAPAGHSDLPSGLRAGIEALSGVSMAGVRVHRNSARPAQLRAEAFAQGRDIHLAPGKEHHLPHEAWHVTQQARGRVKPTMQMAGSTPVNDEPHLEAEADRMGARAMQMAHAGTRPATPATLHTGGTMQKVAQRAGVKAELQEAENNFGDFMQESKLINHTRTEVANAIYNTYKQTTTGTARAHFSDKVAHKGVNPNFDHGIAYEKARRLNHWTLGSIHAATRIYEELLGATQWNDKSGAGLHEITMGQDTTLEPDVYTQNDTAFESKQVDSPAQGSVDGHITKCSKQLNSRKTNNINNLPIKKWVAHIRIISPENPWPYTPVSLKKAVASGNLKVKQVADARIRKYDKASVNIVYDINSENPSVGRFQLKV